MLDMMRRKKRLRIVLWLVILSLALGMLLFFVPGQPTSVSGLDTYAASVDGDEIPLKEYATTYRRVLENFSQGGRNKIDATILKQMNLDRQAVDLLIHVRVIRQTAKRLGLEVSADEIRRAVETHPSLQDNGVFIGIERYKAVLAANSIEVAEFEDGLEYSLIEGKLKNVISDSMVVPEQDLREEFIRANQQAQAGFVIFKKDDFNKEIAPREADLRAYFETNKEKYRIREQRRVQYLLLSLSEVAATLPVSEQELRDRWARDAGEETVDASHILFKVDDPSQEAAVRAKAESVLSRAKGEGAKAPEDFAKLAETHSEDTGSARQGGSLGSFGRGRMVKEFEDAAFSLQPGQISGLVRTQFGFHIIKVNKRDVPDFESRRAGLQRTIQLDKAMDVVRQKSVEAEKLSKEHKDLKGILEALGVPGEIRESGFFNRESEPYSLGISQALRDEAFQIKEIGGLGRAVDHPQGYAVPKLLETQLPKPPDFNESRKEVEKDFIESRAAEALHAAAKKLADEATTARDLVRAARMSGLEVLETPSFKRSEPAHPDLGIAPDFSTAAFELEIGSVSPPILLDGGERVAVLQVRSRTPFDENQYKNQRNQVRERLVDTWKDSYFREYIRSATENLEKSGKIRINQRAMDSVTGLAS